MAGNVFETCISVGSGGTNGGRAFTKTNGDGSLDVNGDANVATWPTSVPGYAFKGGFYSNGAAQLTTSDRFYGINTGALTLRDASYGIRLARTAE